MPINLNDGVAALLADATFSFGGKAGFSFDLSAAFRAFLEPASGNRFLRTPPPLMVGLLLMVFQPRLTIDGISYRVVVKSELWFLPKFINYLNVFSTFMQAELVDQNGAVVSIVKFRKKRLLIENVWFAGIGLTLNINKKCDYEIPIPASSKFSIWQRVKSKFSKRIDRWTTHLIVNGREIATFSDLADPFILKVDKQKVWIVGEDLKSSKGQLSLVPFCLHSFEAGDRKIARTPFHVSFPAPLSGQNVLIETSELGRASIWEMIETEREINIHEIEVLAYGNLVDTLRLDDDRYVTTLLLDGYFEILIEFDILTEKFTVVRSGSSLSRMAGVSGDGYFYAQHNLSKYGDGRVLCDQDFAPVIQGGKYLYISGSHHRHDFNKKISVFDTLGIG